MGGVAEVVEEDAGENGAEFACSGGDTVGETSDARREDFAGDDERGGVGAKVEEELQQGCLARLHFLMREGKVNHYIPVQS